MVEMIDALKFWGNIAALWKMDEGELTRVFEMKTKIVDGRFHLETLPPSSGPRVAIVGAIVEMFADRLAVICDKYDASVLVFNAGDSRRRFDIEYELLGLRDIKVTFGDNVDECFSPFVTGPHSMDALEANLAETLKRIVS